MVRRCYEAWLASNLCLKAKWLLIHHQCKIILFNVCDKSVWNIRKEREPINLRESFVCNTHDVFSNSVVLELC